MVPKVVDHRTGPVSRAGAGQRDLRFSVGDGVPFPPSLVNIFKEVHDDTGAPVPASGNLDRWAEQGVLLLNAVLTVRAHEAASHAGHGWERFTDEVVKAIALRKQGVVYMLWGSYAQRKASVVDPQHNCILKRGPPVAPRRPIGDFSAAAISAARTSTCKASAREPIRWYRMRGGEKLCVCRVHFAGARVARR